MQKKVLISILNWNGGNETINCLNSILNSTFQSYSILIIDNASTDGSVNLIKQQFPWITVIENSDNLGFASAQNQGVQFALKNGYEYVWILNNDTIVNSETLQYLVKALDRNQAIGAVSPVIFESSSSGEEKIQFCGCSVVWDSHYFDLHATLDDALASQDENPDKICLWGTAMFVRTELMANLGGFDDRLFAYYEDLDFSIKIIRAGFFNKIIPEATVYHAGLTDPHKRPPHYVYFNTRNRYLFWKKHLSVSQRINYMRVYLAGALLLAAGWNESGELEKEHATLLGIWDALRNRGGRWDPGRRIPKWVPKILFAHPYFLAKVLRGSFL